MPRKPLKAYPNGNGWRYRKSYQRTPWYSPTYPATTRENEREAWALFCKWKGKQPSKTQTNTQNRISELKQQLSELQREMVGVVSNERTADFIEQTTEEIDDIETELKQNELADQKGIDDLEKRTNDNRAVDRLFGVPDDVPTQWADRRYNPDLVGEPLPNSKLLGYWRDRYFEYAESTTETTPAAWQNIKTDVERLVQLFGEKSNVELQSESDTWETFIKDMKKQDFAGSTEANILARCRNFIDYLDDHEAISRPPKNLKKYKATIVTKKPKHYSLEELNYLLNGTDGFLKCAVWLMANCGMTQKDVADLKPEELENGCITRTRSKKKAGEDLPEVTWKLWPETLNLIEQYRSDRNGLLFTMESGEQWYTQKKTPEGKVKRYDPIRKKLFVPWKKSHPEHAPGLTLKNIRKSAAQYLPATEDKMSAQIKFMCQVPNGVQLKSYVDVEQPIFDKAVEGLGVRILEASPENDH